MRDGEVIRENMHNKTGREPGFKGGVATPKRQAEEGDPAEETVMG